MTILHALVDGALRTSDTATISVTDEGLLRGDGVFEVLRLYGGRPYEVEEHLVRMARSAKGLRLPLDLAGFRLDIAAAETLADGNDALLRLVATRGGRRIALLEPPPALQPFVRLATVSFAPSLVLDGFKTLSYAANVLANRQAVERGADEALFVRTDGTVLEGPNFAVFFRLDGDDRLVTPPLDLGILDSLTRRRIMTLVPSSTVLITRAQFTAVQEAFVVSTVREVWPVQAIDDVVFAPTPGRLTAVAHAAFRRQIGESDAASPKQVALR